VEPRASLVTLGVSDLERSVAFYREGLYTLAGNGASLREALPSSELDRCAGAENLIRMVSGPHGDVRIGSMHQHSCLEAVAGKRFH
jgi:catechol 2,3-dioxygenase-like lactoylglutathione lyase family enzyme